MAIELFIAGIRGWEPGLWRRTEGGVEALSAKTTLRLTNMEALGQAAAASPHIFAVDKYRVALEKIVERNNSSASSVTSGLRFDRNRNPCR